MYLMIFTLLFVATAPIMLMPSLIAMFTRHRLRVLVSCANLAIWGLAYFNISPLFAGRSSSVLPVPVFLVLWLLLLGYVIRSRVTKQNTPPPADPPVSE